MLALSASRVNSPQCLCAVIPGLLLTPELAQRWWWLCVISCLQRRQTLPGAASRLCNTKTNVFKD